MSRRFVQQMADGDAIEEVYLVIDKQLRANRNGNLYLQLELRDRTGAISARLWNAGEHLFRSFEDGDFLLVKGKVQLFQGALQMILSHLERVDSREGRAGRLPAAHRAGRRASCYERLRGFLLQAGQPAPARPGRVLPDGRRTSSRDFCKAPAGIRNHHAYLGGLLEHVVTLLDAADRLAAALPRRGPRPAADGRLPARHRQGARTDATTGPSPTPTRAS